MSNNIEHAFYLMMWTDCEIIDSDLCNTDSEKAWR